MKSGPIKSITFGNTTENALDLFEIPELVITADHGRIFQVTKTKMENETPMPASGISFMGNKMGVMGSNGE